MAGLLSVSTAVPDHCLTAADTKSYLAANLPPTAATRFARMVDASCIRTRHAALPLKRLLHLQTLDARNQEHRQHAIALGEKVARNALLAANTGPEAVSAVIAVSSTGHMMPSLDTYLINRLGLNPTCRRIPLSQLGCAAGVGALGLATELANAGSTGHVLVVSVELPSLSIQIAEPSVTDAMASIQFGDAAAAAVVSRSGGGRGPDILAARTVLFSDTTDAGGSRLTETGLRLMMSPGLPNLVRSRLPRTLRGFLEEHGLHPEDISYWVVHPRAPQILEAVGESLQLSDRSLAPSWAVWERCGNTISSSVFFILRELQETAPPAAGTLGMMLAFGAGVTCEMALVRADGWLARRE